MVNEQVYSPKALFLRQFPRNCLEALAAPGEVFALFRARCCQMWRAMPNAAMSSPATEMRRTSSNQRIRTNQRQNTRRTVLSLWIHGSRRLACSHSR